MKISTINSFSLIVLIRYTISLWNSKHEISELVITVWWLCCIMDVKRLKSRNKLFGVGSIMTFNMVFRTRLKVVLILWLLFHTQILQTFHACLIWDNLKNISVVSGKKNCVVLSQFPEVPSCAYWLFSRIQIHRVHEKEKIKVTRNWLFAGICKVRLNLIRGLQ